MATDVLSIWNQSLSYCGNSDEVQNVDEDSANANACRRFYADDVEEMIEGFQWPFLKVTVALALIEEDPTDEWAFSYAYPSDCRTMGRIQGLLRNETRQSRVPYLIGQDENGTTVIYTDWQDAIAEYTIDGTDPSKFTATFSKALSLSLAIDIAPRVTGGDPTKLMERSTPQAVQFSEEQKAAASHLMQGPVGARLMMERSKGPRRPMAEDQIEALLGDSSRHVFMGKKGDRIRPFQAMFEGMQKAGLSEEQGRSIMAGMKTKDVGDFMKKHGLGKNAAISRLFQERLAAEIGRPDVLEGAIAGQMKGAGVKGDPKAVLAEMRENLKERVKAVMLERGVSEQQARLFVLQEHARRAFPGLNQPAHAVGLQEYGQMVRLGGFGGVEIAKRSLDELTMIRKALQEGKNPAGAAGIVGGAAAAAFPG